MSFFVRFLLGEFNRGSFFERFVNALIWGIRYHSIYT